MRPLGHFRDRRRLCFSVKSASGRQANFSVMSVGYIFACNNLLSPSDDPPVPGLTNRVAGRRLLRPGPSLSSRTNLGVVPSFGL